MNNTVDSLKREKIQDSFEIKSRRFLGNKYKLLDVIESIVREKCGSITSFCDIFSGTGVVGERFNAPGIKLIANDTLMSNYIPLATFLLTRTLDMNQLSEKINYLNRMRVRTDNYFSEHYGNTYFTLENARIIGAIREEIECITESETEKNALITSLLYATDKVANTVGHYDAFRKKFDRIQSVMLLIPKIAQEHNLHNEVYHEDANTLIRKLSCDVLYIDPPYNSRQYCDTYHVLENLATWQKPPVFGKAKKMDRSALKSAYCRNDAPQVFRDLIEHATCRHILVSYNNTGFSKDNRSNARITDKEIISILQEKGSVETFEQDFQAFTAGKNDTTGNAERIFYCAVER